MAPAHCICNYMLAALRIDFLPDLIVTFRRVYSIGRLITAAPMTLFPIYWRKNNQSVLFFFRKQIRSHSTPRGFRSIVGSYDAHQRIT